MSSFYEQASGCEFIEMEFTSFFSSDSNGRRNASFLSMLTGITISVLNLMFPIMRDAEFSSAGEADYSYGDRWR